jgi:acyl-CoA reductase-like NAD-dependent aldehyde dehydrogenase
VARGDIVREIALALRGRREEAAAVVAAEVGKALDLALGEVDAAWRWASSSPAKADVLTVARRRRRCRTAPS